MKYCFIDYFTKDGMHIVGDYGTPEQIVQDIKDAMKNGAEEIKVKIFDREKI